MNNRMSIKNRVILFFSRFIDLDNLAKTTNNISILEYLSKSENSDIRYCVAENRNTTAKILDDIARDDKFYGDFFDVLFAVVVNPNVSAETLDFLSKNVVMAGSVAKHSNTSSETLDFLSNHHDELVRYAVRVNPNTSSETRKRLIEDPQVQFIQRRYGIATNFHTSIETLKILADDTNL